MCLVTAAGLGASHGHCKIPTMQMEKEVQGVK